MKLVRNVFGKRDERLAKQILATKPFVRAAPMPRSLHKLYESSRINPLPRNYIIILVSNEVKRLSSRELKG